jgi:hypothetical protein
MLLFVAIAALQAEQRSRSHTTARCLVRNCLKSPEGASNVASQGTEAPLFGPFRPRYTAKSTLGALLKPLFRQFLTADFGVVGPHRMMRTYGPAEGFTQPLVRAWRVWVNINAIRCET